MVEQAHRHVHNCSTFECANFYVCRDRDCRDEWTCPTCEDNARFDELNQAEREQQDRLAAKEAAHVSQ